MKIRTIILACVGLSLCFGTAMAAGRKTTAKKEVANDTNTPLHLMTPDYKIPYGVPAVEEVKGDMDRVLRFLEGNTPARLVDKNTGAVVDDLSKVSADTQIERGAFRLTSYEWGVVYSAMLAAGKITGDEAYTDYAMDRLDFIAEIAPYFEEVYYKYGTVDEQIRPVIEPRALDDCGAICTAMIKAQYPDRQHLKKPSADVKYMDQIERYFNYIMYKEHRLEDDTFARNRPMPNSVWLDDMYMGIPALSWYGITAHDYQGKFISRAEHNILQFADRMWVPEKKLFRHGWVESMSYHPSFHWARANGWAMLSMCEALDVLPQGPSRDRILDLLRAHIEGVMSYQSSEGFWHQLLDRPDSYLETSATAIYTYCIAHAINEGWIDGKAFGPTAILGWNAVKTKITPEGLVEGTCVGTGMGFDPAFYYARPVSAYAAHGYGPVIWAGAEIIRLIQNQNGHTMDSAVLFYENGLIPEKNMMFGTYNPKEGGLFVSEARKGDNPMVFLIGDSTMSAGNGWGNAGVNLFDPEKVTCVNCGIGGCSTRTYVEEGYWIKVIDAVREGDFIVIDLGQNDDWGPVNDRRARATLPGSGDDFVKVIMAEDGRHETIHTYGWYLERLVNQAKAKGAIVILTSYTAWNIWENGELVYARGENFADWTEDVARRTGSWYVDIHGPQVEFFKKTGEAGTQPYFKDDSHLTKLGAEYSAQVFKEGLEALDGCPLASYLK